MNQDDDATSASRLTAEAILLARDAVIARRPVLLDDAADTADAPVDEDQLQPSTDFEPRDFVEPVWSAHDESENARAIERTRLADAKSAEDVAKQIESLRATCGPGERVNPYTLEIESGDRYHGTIYEGLDDARANRVTHAPGGGGASGRKRERKPNVPTADQDASWSAAVNVLGSHAMSVFGIGHLTLGEWEFYQQRPMSACRAVLEHHVAGINAGTIVPPAAFEKSKIAIKPQKRVEVYGLEEAVITALKKFPGEARRALAMHARSKEGDRITAREKAYAEDMADRKVKAAITRELRKKLVA